MNQYFYIDSLENSSDAILYKIKTDLTKDQLINFIYKKACDYCNENNIDIVVYKSFNINKFVYKMDKSHH